MPLLLILLIYFFLAAPLLAVVFVMAYPTAAAVCLALWLVWRAVRPTVNAAIAQRLQPSSTYVWMDTREPWQGETYTQRGRKPTATRTAPGRAARISPQLVGYSDHDDGE